MKYLSYSTLKLCRDCPACFWWLVNKGIRRENAWQSNLPNVLEREVLKSFEVYRGQDKLPPEFDIKKHPELKGFKLIDKATHDRWKDIRIHEPMYNNLVANPDDALINNGKIAVVDIKTMGSYYENITEKSMLEDIEKYGYKLQLEFYSYVMKMSGMSVEDYGYILFYYIAGADKRGNLILKHNLVKLNLDLNNIPPLIKEGEEILKMESPPNFRCSFCSSAQQRYEDLVEGKEQHT